MSVKACKSILLAAQHEIMNLKMSIRLVDQAGCVGHAPKCNPQLSMIFTELVDVRHGMNQTIVQFASDVTIQFSFFFNSGLKLTYHNAVCFGYLWSAEHESCSWVSFV